MKKLIGLCAFLLLWTQIAMASVNINTANQKEIEALPGIGPAKAAAIITYRTTHGNFTSPGELTKVKGIGQKLLIKIEDKIETE